MMRPGDWSCPSCSFHNFRSRDRCKDCGADKPHGAGMAAPRPDAGRQFGGGYVGGYGGGGRGPSIKPGDWPCPKCGGNNFARRQQCYTCGTPRGNTPAYTGYGDQTGAYAQARGGYGGFGGGYGARPPQQSRPGDWDCSCGCMNFQFRTQCFRCGKPKQAGSERPMPGAGGEVKADPAAVVAAAAVAQVPVGVAGAVPPTAAAVVAAAPPTAVVSAVVLPAATAATTIPAAAAPAAGAPSAAAVAAAGGKNPDFLICLEFNATCDDADTNPSFGIGEIISWRAVVVDVQEQSVKEKEFKVFVKPKNQPQLTDFCVKVTGVTQQQVDAGLPIEEALKQWIEFCTEFGLNAETALVVTRGGWDLGRVWVENARMSSLVSPALFTRYADVKDIFRTSFDQVPQSLDEMRAFCEIKQPDAGMAQVVLALLGRSITFTHTQTLQI